MMKSVKEQINDRVRAKVIRQGMDYLWIQNRAHQAIGLVKNQVEGQVGEQINYQVKVHLKIKVFNEIN